MCRVQRGPCRAFAHYSPPRRKTIDGASIFRRCRRAHRDDSCAGAARAPRWDCAGPAGRATSTFVPRVCPDCVADTRGIPPAAAPGAECGPDDARRVAPCLDAVGPADAGDVLVVGSITVAAAAAALRRRTVVFVYAILHPPTLRHPLVVAAGSGVVLAVIGATWTGTAGRSSAAALRFGLGGSASPLASPLVVRNALGSADSAEVADGPAPHLVGTHPSAASTTPRSAAVASERPKVHRLNIALSDWPIRHTATARQDYTDGQYRVALVHR